jgi:DNA-binding GntR family transcriptional regulator
MTIDVTPEAKVPAPVWHDLDADRTPKYIQVARELRTRIESGEYYQSGECLPSSSYLAVQFGVSRDVVLTALQALAKSGHLRHVESKPHQVIWKPASAPEADPPSAPA